MENANKAKNKASIVPALMRLLKKEAKDDPTLFLSNAVYTLFETVYPFLIVILPKLIIDELVKGSLADTSKLIFIVSAFFVVAGIMGAVKAYLHIIAYNRISNIRIDYIYILCKKLLAIDYQYIEDAQFWEENSNAMEASSGSDNGIELCYKILYELPPLALTIIGLTVFVGFLSPYVLLALIVSVAVSILVNRAASMYRYKLRDEEQHHWRKLQYYDNVTHDFSCGKDIRIYSLKERILNNYSSEIVSYISVIKKFAKRTYLLGFLDLLLLLVSDSLLYYVLIKQVVSGMPIADFSMWLTASITLSTTMRIFSEKLGNMIAEGRYVSDFFEFMDEDYSGSGHGKRPKIEGDTLEITFKNVSFKYPRTDKLVLKNVSFTVHKGEKLAIVGINGAGKTTIVKLITGLFSPSSGEILINGIPQSEFTKEALYSMFSVVFQDVNIYAYTIAENVALSSDKIDREKVVDVLKRVGLEKKLASLESGIDQMLLKVIDENGTELSGGESQKLAIARALYEDANMVILDEPTAALDALAEAEIYQKFDDLVKQKTAIYISHRLASTKFCDHIAFFDGDGLKEYGTHDELMQMRGEYYNMFTVQGKYYQEDAVNE